MIAKSREVLIMMDDESVGVQFIHGSNSSEVSCVTKQSKTDTECAGRSIAQTTLLQEELFEESFCLEPRDRVPIPPWRKETLENYAQKQEGHLPPASQGDVSPRPVIRSVSRDSSQPAPRPLEAKQPPRQLPHRSRGSFDRIFRSWRRGNTAPAAAAATAAQSSDHLQDVHQDCDFVIDNVPPEITGNPHHESLRLSHIHMGDSSKNRRRPSSSQDSRSLLSSITSFFSSMKSSNTSMSRSKSFFNYNSEDRFDEDNEFGHVHADYKRPPRFPSRSTEDEGTTADGSSSSRSRQRRMSLPIMATNRNNGSMARQMLQIVEDENEHGEHSKRSLGSLDGPQPSSDKSAVENEGQDDTEPDSSKHIHRGIFAKFRRTNTAPTPTVTKAPQETSFRRQSAPEYYRGNNLTRIEHSLPEELPYPIRRESSHTIESRQRQRGSLPKSVSPAATKLEKKMFLKRALLFPKERLSNVLRRVDRTPSKRQ